ncbi:MAG: cytochrome c [Polyangiaceae bacterium]
MIRFSHAAIVSVTVLALACGGAGPHSRAAGAASQFALNVKQVAWNPTNAPVGKVTAVADDHDVLAVFSDNGANIFRSGALVARDDNAHAWVTASTIPSIDGASQWIVAVDKNGGLYYVRNLQTLEPVSDRYGFGKSKVRSAALVGYSGGKTLVGFSLDNEIAIADGAQVTRFAGSSFSDFGAGGAFAVGVAHDEVDVIDTMKRTVERYALPNAGFAAVTSNGTMYAATPRAIYTAKNGALTLLYEADDATIHGLVASGTRVWFADGDELGAIENQKVAETNKRLIASDARLASSPSGDVWVMESTGLARFARVDSPQTAGAGPTTITWDTAIEPIFARSCATCHLPGGVSGTDLSNNAAWNSERTNIHDRVVVHQTMPPQGHPLSDADRNAIRSWTESTTTLAK